MIIKILIKCYFIMCDEVQDSNMVMTVEVETEILSFQRIQRMWRILEKTNHIATVYWCLRTKKSSHVEFRKFCLSFSVVARKSININIFQYSFAFSFFCSQLLISLTLLLILFLHIFLVAVDWTLSWFVVLFVHFLYWFQYNG